MPHFRRYARRPLFALSAALLLLLPRSAAHAGAFADSLVRADPTLTADLLPLPEKAPPLSIHTALRTAEYMLGRGATDSCSATVLSLLRAHPRDVAVQVACVDMLNRTGLGAIAIAYCDSLWKADTTSALTAALYSQVLEDSLSLPWAERAIRLDPLLAQGWCDRAQILFSVDRNGSLRNALRALALDPSLTAAWRIAAWAFVLRADSVAAPRAFAGEIASDSSMVPSLLYYATHSLRKRPQWGLIALEAIPPGFNSLVDGARGWLLARAGRTGEARALADDLIRDPEAADFPRRLYSRAVTFAALGSPDTAFAALARACEAGYADGFSFDSDQEAWRTVWNDPRYALLEKVVAQAHADKLAGTSASYDSLATLVDAAARRPAPEADLRDSTGARVSLADFRGKIVLLDFWSTWCGWCRTGMPLMSEFAKSLPADRFVVLSVQVQEMDSTGWVRGPEIFRSGHYGMRYTRGTASTQDAFHARGLPTLVILDRTGRVALTHTDYLHDPRAVIGPILDQLRAEHALPRGR